ncbi:hypothetical protein BN946_scf184873.g24 [Trametes cinnabarina]|uniref:Non-structural maintenance of chromosomes element 4 n=1 Tax=Pycnoporus cinnabarinus TaxID=5643 RepID=A0A060SNH5_PYCCI|nr:hypothetical protein BN946_scf184873.g24 [Trametes cinnabarina]
MAVEDVHMDEERMAYDPDQDPEEARNLRRQYRHLEQELTGTAENQDLTTEEVAEKLRNANNLFEQVQGINEATNDSGLLVIFSQISAAKARAMKSGSSAFDVDDFVARLITYMGGRKPVTPADDADDYEDGSEYNEGAPLDWEKIARRALAKSRRVPAMDFMLIVNPNDFAQSVENMFYLSFLIRDGKCALEIDEDSGEPMIMLCEQPTQEDYDAGLVKHQIVMEFDMATWRRAIEVFEIKEPMIPTRPKSEMRIGQKWYG